MREYSICRSEEVQASSRHKGFGRVDQGWRGDGEEEYHLE